jgi:hypothetical protein
MPIAATILAALQLKSSTINVNSSWVFPGAWPNSLGNVMNCNLVPIFGFCTMYDVLDLRWEVDSSGFAEKSFNSGPSCFLITSSGFAWFCELADGWSCQLCPIIVVLKRHRDLREEIARIGFRDSSTNLSLFLSLLSV